MGVKITLQKLISVPGEEKKNRLASFPIQNPNPVIELGVFGNLEFANPAALETARKLGLRSVFGLLPKDIKKIIKGFKEGKIRQAYREVNFKDITFGENIHWTPQFKAARVFAVDITTRKKAEEKLKKINDELEQEVEKRTDELARHNRALKMLSYCKRALIYSSSEKHLLKEICRIIVEVGGYRWAWIGSAEQDEKKSVKVMAQAGSESGYLESANITWSDKETKGRGPIGFAIRTGKIFVGKDFSKNKNLLPWKMEAMKRGFGSVIALPIKRNQEVFGVLTVYSKEIDDFPKKEIELLYELSEDLAFGINTLRARQYHEQTETLMKTSNDLLNLSNRASNRQDYLDRTVRYLRRWCGCGQLGIRILQKEEYIPYESHSGYGREFLLSENMLSIKKDECACARVVGERPEPQDRNAMTQGGSFYTNDSVAFYQSLTEKEKSRFRGKCIRCGFASIAVIPIRRKKMVLGAIHMADKRAGLFSPRKIEALESMAVLIGEAINKFNAQERLIESYKHLGLINRKIPALLEMERFSKVGKKKEVAQQVLHLAVNVSGSDLGLLYRLEDDKKFALHGHLGIYQGDAKKLKTIENKNCQIMKYLIQKKGLTQIFTREALRECFKIDTEAENFLVLPLWKKINNKIKGLILLGLKNSSEMDSHELEFYDLFSMHASSALLSAEVFK